jgi:hypothetical protein
MTQHFCMGGLLRRTLCMPRAGWVWAAAAQVSRQIVGNSCGSGRIGTGSLLLYNTLFAALLPCSLVLCQPPKCLSTVH